MGVESAYVHQLMIVLELIFVLVPFSVALEFGTFRGGGKLSSTATSFAGHLICRSSLVNVS